MDTPIMWCQRVFQKSGAQYRLFELVRYGFIKIRMKVVNFIKKFFIKNHFHQKPLSSKTTLKT